MATQAPTLFDDLFSNEEKNEIPPAAVGNKKKKNLAAKETTSSPELFPTEPTLFEESLNETSSESLVDTGHQEENILSIPAVDLNIEQNEESLFDISEDKESEATNADLKEENPENAHSSFSVDLNIEQNEESVIGISEDKESEATNFDLKEEIQDKTAQLADLDKTMRAEMPFFFELAPPLENTKVAKEKAVEETEENIELEKEENILGDFGQDFFEAEIGTASELPLIQSNESTLPNWNLENKYYGIGAVAELFGVNISHIRFWTNEFKLKVRTNKKGDRLYTPELIEKLRLIHHLVKEKGHTIKGAKAQLKTKKEVVSASISLKEQLSQLRDNLLAIRGDLNKNL